MKIIVFSIQHMYHWRGLIDNKSALGQAMAWCWKGDNPLVEPMIALFTNTFMHDLRLQKMRANIDKNALTLMA